MAKFEPGQKKPEGSGRKKGTMNKKSHHLYSLLEERGIDVPSLLIELLPRLEESKQADILMGLMGFLYPKRKSVESYDAFESTGKPINFSDLDILS